MGNRIKAFRAAAKNFAYLNFGIRSRQRKARKTIDMDSDLESYLKSHICRMPFQNLEITDRGHLHVCCPDWLPMPIGSMHFDILTQWRGEQANRIRESIVSGTYKYCNRQLCTVISERFLIPRDSKAAREIIDSFRRSEITPPDNVSLSYDRSCNLSCPSCRKERIVADKAEQDRLDTVFERSALPLLRGAKSVYITGSGDPFASNHFRRVIKRLNRKEFGHLRFDLHTNAQLFDARAWHELDLSGRVHGVQISIDAADPETYAVVRRGGTFQNLRKNLTFIADLRRGGEILELTFSMVVQARNFREMPAFVRLAEEFSADAASFQMIRNWGTFSDAEFTAEFIGDPTHPQHPDLIAVMAAPEMSRPITQAGNILGYVSS
jgi:hypothetical protein